MNRPDVDPRRTAKAWREIAADLLVAYKWPIVIGLVVLVGAIAWIDPDLPTIDVPRDAKVFVVAGVLAAALGAMPAQKIIDWLYDPPKRIVVCLGLRETADPGIFEMSPAAWEQVEVTDGELYEWPGMKYPTYEAEDFDAEAMTAVGTWRGSKPDKELLRNEKKIEELRAEIEPEADMSVDLELSISSRVRKAVKAIGQAVIDEHASASVYNGERITDVLTEIRQDVEADAEGEDRRDDGEKPVRDEEAIQAGLSLLDSVGQGAPADD